MTIGAYDCGYRIAENMVQQKTRWQSVGVSQSAAVTVLDFGHAEQDINVSVLVSEATKNNVATYLNDTIKPFGAVTVTPDASDTLEGMTTAGVGVSLLFVNFTATFVCYNQWQLDVTFRKYS